jgi:hypothetical protein
VACQNLNVTDSPSIRAVRVYELGVEDRGSRWLVDRRWPRGVRRDSLELAGWAREAAPSDELRRWFGHVRAVGRSFGDATSKSWMRIRRRGNHSWIRPATAISSCCTRPATGTGITPLC